MFQITLLSIANKGGFTIRLCALFIALLSCVYISAQSQTNISTPAYGLINTRTAADQGSFYVYLDQDSGFNHGFPSGFMGTDQATITLNSGCIDSSSSSTGCTSDPTVLDRVHGTVMSVSFAAQPSGNFAGLALEEPQKWLALQYGNGYNLTGATSVSFNVRSPNGAQVQFGVAGCTTPFTPPISSTWTAMTLSLNTSSLSCNPALSNVHLLFEVLTNDVHDPAGATVLLDNIQFNPVPTVQAAALSFPLANQTFGVVPQQASPFPSDQILKNTSTIYESALAEYILLARAAPQDLQDAQLIANTFDYALHHESHGDPIPAAAGGYTGLHNGYENGDIGLYNNQPPPLLGQAGDIRLAGFTDTSLCSPSGYCAVLDGASGGNNAFAIIALLDAYRQFGNVSYLNDALTIGNWIIGNLTDTTGTGYGGYYVGYGDEGIPPPKPLETGKSTENNADIFAALTALANIVSQLGNASAAASWTTAANVAGDFVMQMYDPVHGRFNVGTSPVGTPASPGTCPTGTVKGGDVINVCDFLDSNTFTTLAMAGAPRYRYQIDWRQPIQYVLNTFAQTVTAAGQTYSGFDIVPTPDSGANGIAWEFTGQTVEAMNYVDALYYVTTFQAQANFYLGQIALAQSSAPFGDGLGIVASTLQGGDTLTPLNQCLSTPYQCIAERVGLAATSWGILAEKELNYYKFLPAPGDPPAAVSLTPPGSTSVTQTFTAVYTDAAGPSDLQVVYLLANTGLNGTGACEALYVPASNQLLLANDAGNGPVAGAITPGAAGTLSNSQCTLASGGAVTSTATTLTVPFTMTAKSGFAGSMTLFGIAFSVTGTSDGWQTLGTWIPYAGVPPTATSVSPVSSTGLMRTFTAVYTDDAGPSNLQVVYLLANTGLNGTGACEALYVPSTNQLLLANDAGNGPVAGAITPGAAGTLSNSQCTLASGGAVTSTATTLTVPFTMTATSSFTGSMTLFGIAFSVTGTSGGWYTLGTWIPHVGAPPTATSVSPASSTGVTQTFTAVYTDTAGPSDLQVVYLLANAGLNGTGACNALYVPSSNQLLLANDAGNGPVAGAITPGGGGTLSNSQCTLASGGAVTSTATTLTVPFTMTANNSFTGSMTLFGIAFSVTGTSGGWYTLGTWIP